MKRILVTVAIATAFSASPTMAASYSNASLSNFQVSLVDLDLEDGVTPSVSLKPYYSFLRLSASSAFFSYGLDKQTNGIRSVSRELNNTTNTARASVHGDNIDNKVLQVSGRSVGHSSVYQHGYQSAVSDGFRYTLTPNTQLNITAEARNYVETTIGTADENEYADSYAGMQIMRNNGSGLQNSNNYLVASSLLNDSALKLRELTLLSLMVDNGGGQELTGFFQSIVFTNGFSDAKENEIPAQVPVPAALPLMASSIGLFGLGAKRRKALKA